LNQTGQAYSTFKLLIAAIVAMAILAILIPIILQAIGWLTASPSNEAKTLLNDLVSSSGSLQNTPEVAFKPGDVLAASALAEGLPVSKDQICMSLGQFEKDETNGFECIGCDGDEQHRIIWRGASNRTAKIAAVCNVDLDSLKEDISVYGLESFDTGENDISSNCEICEDKGKCCALVLKRP